MQPAKAWIINDTIEKNKRVFKIPVYQRNYDWSTRECTKLYEDIINAYKTQKKHFTGTIVYITGDRASSQLTEDLIIDGQQRLTTVMILLKALLDTAVSTDDSIKSELKDLLFNRHCEEEHKLKLKPVKADDKQFQALMRNDTDEYDLNSNIIRNYNLFIKLISGSLDAGYLLSDILEGMKELEIVEIVLDKAQGDDPQVIFESINSTGLELSLADKIRNFVLMDDVNQDFLFERYWLPIEEKIGSKSLAQFFITYLDFKVSEKISNNNAYDNFTKYCREKDISHENLLKDMLKYAKYYSAFIGRNNTYDFRINKYLQDFRDIDQSTLYLFLFNVFEDYECRKIDLSILLKVLRFFRSYTVRRIICERSSNSLKGLFKTLYSRIFKEQESYENYYENIFTFFVTTNTKDKLVSDDEFLDSLINKNLYTKKKVCKFLLASIENERSNEQLNVENLTIEHIMPQKENALVWTREIGDDYFEVYTKYLHTLGNLTITGHNSELGTKSFAEKKKIIRDLSKARILNESILSAEKWNEESILRRAKSLANEVLELFELEETTILGKPNISNDDKTYNLDNQDIVSGTTPYYFTFYGEVVAVKSYIGMLKSVLNILYELDTSILEELAKKKFQVTAANSPYLTTDISELRRGKELGNTGIFYEANLSADYILQFIKAAIEAYDMDTDEFEFVCK